MKNWKEKISGVLAFILAIFLSLAICTEIVADEEVNIIIEKTGAEFTNDSIVSIISEEEYEKLIFRNLIKLDLDLQMLTNQKV